MNEFGGYIRKQLEELHKEDRCFSLRQVAKRIGIEPAYLRKIERGDFAPPPEDVIRKLSNELGEIPDWCTTLEIQFSSCHI